MTNIELRTWKYSDYYGDNLWWDNRYYFRVPFDIDSDQMYEFGKFVMNTESGICHTHVKFRHCTIQLAGQRLGGGDKNAQTVRPNNPDLRGYWYDPNPPVPYHYALCVRKYSGGNGSNWMFRGCITMAQIQELPSGKIHYTGVDWMRGTIDTWLNGYKQAYNAQLINPQHGNLFGGETFLYNSVDKVLVLGVSKLNAKKRRVALGTPKGMPVFETLVTTQRMVQDWWWQLRKWHDENGDYSPFYQIKDGTKTVLGEIKAALTKAKDYAEGNQQQEGEQESAAVFRYPPGASGITSITSSLIDRVALDIETIDKMTGRPGPLGDFYMWKNDVDTIHDMFPKYIAALTRLNPADWRNYDQIETGEA